jgi:C1A family cysteine protease
MNFSLLCLVFGALFVTVFADQHWKNYKANHGKDYDHPVEESARKRNFLKVHAMIEAHNKGNHLFKMAHNFLSDKHEHEKIQHRGAMKPDDGDDRVWQPSQVRDSSLPASVDYRTDKCMQPIKSQGHCGSCYTFASTCPLEFSSCKKTGNPVNLSEQQIVDCDTTDGGCHGGWYYKVWKYFQTVGGSESTAAYGKYTSGTTKQPGNCSFNSSGVAAQVADYSKVDANAAAMVKAIQNGPLAVALYVVDTFDYYSSGIYSDSTCNPKPKALNHAVTLVGYGTANGTDYWILRNSWGAKWGQGGYMLIKRGVNMCNIENWAWTVTAA